jgi:hypothetical protein
VQNSGCTQTECCPALDPVVDQGRGVGVDAGYPPLVALAVPDSDCAGGRLDVARPQRDCLADP